MISRILIIGGGVIARTHADAVRSLQPARQLCVAEPNEAVRAKFQEDYPEGSYFASADEMLALPREGDEVVVVATPPWLHHRYAMAAFATGRHVLCEKPLGISAGEGDQIFAESRRRGLHFACCSVRYLNRPVLAAAKAVVDSGSLGRPLHVQWQARLRASRPGIEYQPASKWFLQKKFAGGGVLLDWGPYDIATFNALFSPREVIVESAWTSRPERGPAQPADVVIDVEHHVSATLKYVQADGQIVRIDYQRMSTTFGAPVESYQVEGPLGAVEWDWLEWKGDTLRVHRDRNGEDDTTSTRYPEGSDDLSGRRPVRTFVEFLEGGSPSLIRDEQAWFNFRILWAIQEAATTGQPQRVVFPGAKI